MGSECSPSSFRCVTVAFDGYVPPAEEEAGEVGSAMLQLRGVTKTYGGAGETSAVAGVDLDVEAGELCALVGPSGSGKSTLLNLIGLLDRPTSGSVMLRGRDLAQLSRTAAARVRNAEIGLVFQAFHLLPRLSAWENVALPLIYRGAPRAARQARALAMLERVGLAD